MKKKDDNQEVKKYQQFAKDREPKRPVVINCI